MPVPGLGADGPGRRVLRPHSRRRRSRAGGRRGTGRAEPAGARPCHRHGRARRGGAARGPCVVPAGRAHTPPWPLHLGPAGRNRPHGGTRTGRREGAPAAASRRLSAGARGEHAPAQRQSGRRDRRLRAGPAYGPYRHGHGRADGSCGLHHGQYGGDHSQVGDLLGDRGQARGVRDPGHAERRLRYGLGKKTGSERKRAQKETRRTGATRVAKTGAEVPRVYGGPAGWISVLVPAAIFVWFLQFLAPVAAGEQVLIGTDWVPSMDIRLSFLIDGLSLTFGLLISGIGALVTLYSTKYLGNHPEYPRFVLFLLLFMVGMLGLVLSDNLIALFVFWEVTTISSYLLIGFDSDSAKSRRSALQALLLTGTGGLALLAGMILLGNAAGSFELSEILTMGDEIRAHEHYIPILILFLAGAFTKSAQFPFHFWLPNAMAAPTPVSAYLHSATMVKAGVYLLARMHPSLSGTDVWLWTLMIFGGTTAVFASVVALRQVDLKQTLAYTTLMALGTLTMFLAAPGGYALTGFATFLVVHSLYKAALFLMIGCVDYRTGTRSADELGGLISVMPWTGAAAALAALSMAGMGAFIGFIGKELLYKGGLEFPGSPGFVIAATFAASALMFCIGGVVGLKPFWGSTDNLPARHSPKSEAPWPMLTGPLLLAVLGLWFGIFPLGLETNVITPIVAALTGDAAEAKHLHIWTGVNAALYL